MASLTLAAAHPDARLASLAGFAIPQKCRTLNKVDYVSFIVAVISASLPPRPGWTSLGLGLANVVYVENNRCNIGVI
jgi:hypothetical protein